LQICLDCILQNAICDFLAIAKIIMPWLQNMARHAEVWVADPGRACLPPAGMTALRRMTVPTTLELEDRHAFDVTLWRLEGTKLKPGR
jgi:predicted nicotinamide N-methyase